MRENRRRLLRLLGATGFGALAGMAARRARAEPPLETTQLRLSRVPTACLAPQYVAEPLLRAEGFDDIRYIGEGTSQSGIPGARAMGRGETDVAMNFAAPLVLALDEGAPIVLLGGVHSGCFTLFTTERVRAVSDLKGKTVATLGPGSAQQVFLASIATSVGVDPRRDIRWLDLPAAESKRRLAEGSIDAFLAFPPDAQELRANRVGKALLDSATDRPWSQYFCCLAVANRAFAERNPVATKRALRAILKASELCAADPDLGARAYLARGFATDAGYARQAIRELPYGRWRELNPEETVRFYALRLREAGMVKAAPHKLIAQGTDWRVFEQLKREMKT
jgi:NitT/TauT family transport system substrate-binding protein